MLQSALVALIAFGVVLEIFLNFGKDLLLGRRQQEKLDTSIQQAQEDLRASKQKIEDRRAALKAAVEEAERQRGVLQAAEKAFQESQKVVPVLIHVIGLPHSGMRFRAPVSKELPLKPDPSQKMIWSCKNFIEVWGEDEAAARTAIAKQFQEKQGYKIGEMTACAPEATSFPEVAA
jgi:hypothetical protein